MLDLSAKSSCTRSLEKRSDVASRQGALYELRVRNLVMTRRIGPSGRALETADVQNWTEHRSMFTSGD